MDTTSEGPTTIDSILELTVRLSREDLTSVAAKICTEARITSITQTSSGIANIGADQTSTNGMTSLATEKTSQGVTTEKAPVSTGASTTSPALESTPPMASVARGRQRT